MSSVNSDQFELKLGKVVGKRWKVIGRLGRGECGAVFMVEDIKTRAKAALKAEPNQIRGGGVLKLEVQILRRLEGRKHVPQLFHAARKATYSYLVMTLLGDNLEKLFRLCRREFSISTQMRLGIQLLFALKQLHEVGFVHRDVKPSNLALGRGGENDGRIVFLLDFGLAREFIFWAERKVQMRRERSRVLFRGTVRYCSPNTHLRKEQGRCDDLWSLLYVLAEMRGSLPWGHLNDEKEVGLAKEFTSDVRLLSRSPSQLLDVPKHLRELRYYCRPDYPRIYSACNAVLQANGFKFSDPYDWNLIPIIRRRIPSARIKTIESASGEKPWNSTKQKASNKERKVSIDLTLSDSEEDGGYRIEDFKKNVLGF
ncbi:hypothetical protein L596_020336 [Steinernema carpocapsae]|uniref:Protein kinase domain-containing protein n=1 Tax=Steinernema carpocapsae TaxID=34508 RepID=A0A4U5MTF0_STECR|nr:hypothetical protein L596_020336 [Steinernema carpocapsae]